MENLCKFNQVSDEEGTEKPGTAGHQDAAGSPVRPVVEHPPERSQLHVHAETQESTTPHLVYSRNNAFRLGMVKEGKQQTGLKHSYRSERTKSTLMFREVC